MKKIVLYIAAVCCLSFSSCSFLDEKSQDEVRPSTVDDLIQLMLGEGYILSADLLPYFDLLSDDVQSKYVDPSDYANSISFEQYKNVYMWDSRMYEFEDGKGIPGYNHWEYIYARIMGCNVVLSMIDNVVGGHEPRENLRGQALAMRGFYYFMLANIYSMPYTSGNPDEIMGIPIILEPQFKDSYPPRAPLSAVYDQVIADLTAAYPLLNKYGQDNVVYRATDKFVNALLCRVYLYMGEWTKSLEFANYVIEKYPSLQKLSNHIELVDDPFGWLPASIRPNFKYNVYGTNSVESIWGYSLSSNASELFIASFVGTPAWSVSSELAALYKKDPSKAEDCRNDFYIIAPGGRPLFMDKGARSDGGGQTPCQGIRTAEVYLNRAEANIMLAIEGKGGDITRALSDINTLRESRFNTIKNSYTPWTTSDPQELLKMYRDERRRELAFEKHRWFDLRRWGVLGFSHTIEIIKGTKETVVFDNQKKYALPIPEIVIERNPSIKQNLY